MRPSVSLLVVVAVAVVALSTTVQAAIQQPLFTRDPTLGSAPVRSEGTSDVNLFTGSLGYTYPIEVPPGTNGLAPSISLTYQSFRSHAVPSVVGTGWELTQSFIQRNTNHTANTSNTTDDYFELLLNGQTYKLTYVPEEGRYHTEIESYLNIQNVSGGQNNKDMYWLVRDLAGTSYRFGFTKPSESVSNRYDYVWRWHLDRTEDTYGNAIVYNYSENISASDFGVTYLTNVSYSTELARVVELVYEQAARSDTARTMDNGNILKQTRRLKAIVVKANNSLVRKYALGYLELGSEKKAFLANITMTGADNTSTLPPVRFGYSSFQNGWTLNDNWEPPACFIESSGLDEGVRFGDLNGDGLIDMIQAKGGGGVCGTKNVWINTGHGWVNASTVYPNPAIWYPPTCFVDAHEDEGVRLADVNGDGLIDMLQGKKGGVCGSQNTWINTGDGWENDSRFQPPTCFVTNHLDNGVRLADVNGDGLVDILEALGDNNCLTNNAYINTGSGWANQSALWALPICPVDSSNVDKGVRLSDLNGDGLLDVVKSIAGSTGSCDGTADTKEVWINVGAGWVNATRLYNESNPWKPPTNMCFVTNIGADNGVRLIDVNGDGLEDLVRGIGNACTAKETYINTQSGWLTNSSWTPPRCFANDSRVDLGLRAVDVNGDGLTDFLQTNKTDACTAAARTAYINNAAKTFLLARVTTSLGGTINITYNDSTVFNNSVVIPGTNRTASSLAFDVWAVVKLTRQGSSALPIFSQSYNYTGGMYDYPIQEFRGFQQVDEFRSDGSVVRHFFHQDKGRSGREYRTERIDVGNNRIAQQDIRWISTKNESASTTPFYVVTLEEVNDTRIYANTTVTSETTYTYDQFGNVITKVAAGDAAVSGDEITELFEYAYNTSGWIVNTQKRHRLFDTDGTTLLRESNYSYDKQNYGESPVQGSVTKKEDYSGGTNPVTLYSYNSHGNLVNQTDANNHTTTYEYGANETTFTFPDKMVNAKGQETLYRYNLSFGQQVKVTDPNHLVTTATLDMFGRIANEVRPYDSASFPTTVYSYSFDGTAPEQTKISRRERNGTSSTYDAFSFVDGFGQVIQTKSEGENGTQIVVDTAFDGLGRVANRSNPYLITNASNYSTPNSSVSKTRFVYDAMDRSVLVINPDLTQKRFAYVLRNTTTTDENGHNLTQETDAHGRVIKVYEENNEPQYVTQYTYNGASDLTQIVDNEGHVTIIAYDGLGCPRPRILVRS